MGGSELNGHQCRLFASADGNVWEQCQIPLVFHVNGVAFGNGVFVVSVGTLYPSILTSVDGLNWTQGDPGTLPVDGIYFDGDRFIKAAKGQHVLVTPDLKWSADGGRSWVQATQPTEGLLTDVAYGNGSFVAVGADGVVIQSPEAPFLSFNTGSQPGLRVETQQQVPTIRLEGSTNLLSWKVIAELPLTNGVATFTPTQLTPHARYFRAVVP